MPRLKILKLSLSIVLAISFASAALAQATASATAPGKLVEVKISAPSLKGNLLGDPTEHSVAVYLPPSYDASPAKRYPTLYRTFDGRVRRCYSCDEAPGCL